MLVDAHCHLVGGDATETQLEAVLDRARRAGVSGFITVGTGLEDSRRGLELASRHADIQVSAGLHPHEASLWNQGTGAELAELLQDPKVRFVGETGLDWHYELSPRDTQKAVFRAQIQLALRFSKPLMIHTRQAPQETLDILREEGASAVSGIIHCFSEDRAFAEKALDLGFYLSFSGIVTFKNAAAIREVAAWAPEDRILVETDSPFLAPVPHRGKTNEPAFVTHVAAQVAALRGLTAESLGRITTLTLEALCGWAPSS